MQNCPFCLDPDLDFIHCMHISLFFKHNEELDRNLSIIEKLVFKKKCQSFLRFQEVVNLVDRYENMTDLYEGKQLKSQKQDLLEYYKYRKFIPMFGITKQAETIHNYYYERYKLYYNQIKKKLNITLEKTDTQESSQRSSYEQQGSNKSSIYDHSLNLQKNLMNEVKSKILNDLTTDIPTITNQNNYENKEDIQGYKSQSKALEDLVYLLKSNDKFRFVQPLKFQNSNKFPSKSSKQLFKDTVVSRAKQFADYNNSKFRNKKKLFITFGNENKNDSQGASSKYLQINLKQLELKKKPKSKKRQSINFDQRNFHKKTSGFTIISTQNKIKKNSDILMIPSVEKSKNLQILKKLSKIKKQIFDNKLSQVNLYRQQYANQSHKKINSKIFIKSSSKNNIFHDQQDKKLIKRSVSRGSIQGLTEKVINRDKLSTKTIFDDHVNKMIEKLKQKDNKVQQSPYYEKLVGNIKNKKIKENFSKKDLRKYNSEKKIKSSNNNKKTQQQWRNSIQSFGNYTKMKSLDKNQAKNYNNLKEQSLNDANFTKMDMKRRRSVDLTKIKNKQYQFQPEKDKERILQNFMKQSLKKNKRQNSSNQNLKQSPQHVSKDNNNNFPPSLSNLYTMDLLPSKFGIKTAPISPKKGQINNQKYKQSNEFKVTLQKQDNIISINKKKLEVLKQRAQTFKSKIQ